ncbi:hypothetical protein NCCP2716_17800 [Sporosarcina sp. NCCP-2716]|uniref:DUF1648 domain-containing protein n=1 Tax=Sporosarcina sp. NCCP-2716 TaxID=2943679 RepID=UPI00203B6EE2|nr:DUF1648 domain-containing protein [Sporosarcina sp. NCCP-2716]GKV69282.1 hypothetical protein NCCP2716_17800 [Sporosarcina sp. NCCP-2716]
MMGTKRFDVETEKTMRDRVCDWIGLLLFALSIGYTVFYWNALPDEVPIHFNGSGEVDGYGSKWVLLLMPMIGVGMLALLGFLERHPEWHNYPHRLNEENARQFYTHSRTMLNRVKNITLVLFAQIQVDIVRVPLGARDGLSTWSTGFLIALLLIIIIAGAIRQVKIK